MGAEIDSIEIRQNNSKYITLMSNQPFVFEAGASEFEAKEKQGFLDVQRITEQFPISYGKH